MYALLILLSFILTHAAMPVADFTGKRLKIIDYPDKRKIHSNPTPRIGGIAIFISISIILLLLYFRQKEDKVLYLFLGNLIIFITGLLDDLFNLNPWQKILGQIAASTVIIWGAKIVFFINTPALSFLNLHILSVLFTVVWIIGVTNAVNLIDGMDGLAGGLSFFSFFAVLFVAVSKSLHLPAMLSSAMIGAVLGFLSFNMPPAKLFAGDSGSLVLGFNLSVLSLAVSYKTGAIIGILFPSLFVLIPLFDTILAIARRVKKGVNPLTSPDREHLHHKILLLNFSVNQALIIFYTIAGTLSIVAVTVKSKNLLNGLIMAFGFLFLFVLFLSFLKQNKFDEKIKEINLSLNKFRNNVLNFMQKFIKNGKLQKGYFLITTFELFLFLAALTFSSPDEYSMLSVILLAVICYLISKKRFAIEEDILTLILFWSNVFLINIIVYKGYQTQLALLTAITVVPFLIYEVIFKKNYLFLFPKPIDVMLGFTVILCLLSNTPEIPKISTNCIYALLLYLAQKTVFGKKILQENEN